MNLSVIDMGKPPKKEVVKPELTKIVFPEKVIPQAISIASNAAHNSAYVINFKNMESMALTPRSKAPRVIHINKNYQARNFDTIDVDTLNNIVEVTLPKFPIAGVCIDFLDVKSNFDINKLIVKCNGNLIMNVDEDMDVTERNKSFRLRFTDNNWRVVK